MTILRLTEMFKAQSISLDVVQRAKKGGFGEVI